MRPLFCLVMWKLIRVDEDCWMQIPQGGRITYLQKYVPLSIFWQQRSLDQCQVNQGNSNEGKAFLFQVTVPVGQQWSLLQGLLMAWGQTNWWSWSCLIHHSSYRKPQKQVHGSNSRAVPSKTLLEFWLKRKVTEMCGAPGACPSLMAGSCSGTWSKATHTQCLAIKQSHQLLT